MKTNQSDSRSEHARNEKRDSQGRFESNDQKSGSTKSQKSSSEKMDHRGENAKNEPRDSQGRFESKNSHKK